MPSEARLLALDWGTSALRAYLLGADGAVLERRAEAAEILTVRDQRFRATFERVCSDLLAAAPDVPVVACGMIGSRQGWREAPYVRAPAHPETVARNVIRLDVEAGRPFAIVPGLSQGATGEAPPDVMRGEETKLLGILVQRRVPDALVVMPGTHSKWARLSDGRVERFRTFMTGETFDVLSRHSILGRLFEDGNDRQAREQAFEGGVRASQASGGSLLNRLFGVRTLGLTGVLPALALRDHLSGLLIGEEMRAGLTSELARGDVPLLLVGSKRLVGRYGTALSLLGRTPETLDEDIVAVGLHAVARTAGLCP